jgi:uncharacterized membrane protein
MPEPDGPGTGRTEAFSDGVMAVALTLLVLEVKVPAAADLSDAELWAALGGLGRSLAAWAISFAFVLVFWVAHHSLFALLARVDRTLFWLNGLFLLAICFVPVPTALAVQRWGSAPAAFLLSLAMFAAAASFSLLRWYACFRAPLVHPGVAKAVLRAAMRRSLAAPALYALAAALSLLWPPAAIAIQAGVPLLYVMPPRRHA